MCAWDSPCSVDTPCSFAHTITLCSIDNSENMLGCWETNAISAVDSSRGRPKMRSKPEKEDDTAPDTRRRNELFPDPDFPIMAVIFAGASFMETPFSTLVEPYEKDRLETESGVFDFSNMSL